MQIWANGTYRFVKDDDGHAYIIPADKQEEFRIWVEYMESDGDEEYTGEDFGDYRLGSHPSCYVITGSIERSTVLFVKNH